MQRRSDRPDQFRVRSIDCSRGAAMSGLALDIIVDDDRWTKALGDAEALANACSSAAVKVEPRLDSGAALLLADDATLMDLNRRFRGIDTPTNVLAFPAAPAGSPFLGDIAIAYETCAREAAEQGIAFRDHAAHLIIHGLLHLAGREHEADEEAEVMEQLETRILAALGIADPYGAGESR